VGRVVDPRWSARQYVVLKERRTAMRSVRAWALALAAALFLLLPTEFASADCVNAFGIHIQCDGSEETCHIYNDVCSEGASICIPNTTIWAQDFCYGYFAYGNSCFFAEVYTFNCYSSCCRSNDFCNAGSCNATYSCG
jgi:hypothetical protein